LFILRSSAVDEHGLMYVVSGAGNICCKPAEKLSDVPPEYLQWYLSRENKGVRTIGGFSSLSFSADNMSMSFYDQDGTELFTTVPVMPRKK
jgi:tartrate-resistant acid phosphatase type 5